MTSRGVRADDGALHAAPVFVSRHDRPRVHRGGAVTHSFAAVCYATRGVATVEQAGTRWTLRAGHALVVPAGASHRRVDEDHHAWWGLGVSPASLHADGLGDLLGVFARVRAGAAAVVAVPPARRGFVETLFEELAAARAPVIQRSLTTVLLAEVGGAAAPAVAGRGAGVVAAALAYIEERCLGPLAPRDVAAAVGRSPTHLTTALRRATGRGLGAWITAGRLAEARRRLRHGDESIEDVADRVGYRDVTHFIRVFRRAHGVTPAAWRARGRG